MMWDFTFGGIYDDAFSATILTHIWKSMTRVYGGFFLAAAVGIPLGLMISRIKTSYGNCSIRPSACCGRSR